MTPKYPYIVVQLSGRDDIALAMIGRVMLALKRASVPDEELQEFMREAQSPDADQLLKTCRRWVAVE
jgi:hypothetical protein